MKKKVKEGKKRKQGVYQKIFVVVVGVKDPAARSAQCQVVYWKKHEVKEEKRKETLSEQVVNKMQSEVNEKT